MRVTTVKVSKVENPRNKVIGHAEIVLDSSIVIHGIRIIENKGHRFLAFPNTTKYNEGSVIRSDVVHPINMSTRQYLEKEVFERFDELD